MPLAVKNDASLVVLTMTDKGPLQDVDGRIEACANICGKAAEHGLDRLLFVIQSKNYPAMQFCRKLGFEFCGFNELHFSNRDIALFFGHDLR